MLEITMQLPDEALDDIASRVIQRMKADAPEPSMKFTKGRRWLELPLLRMYQAYGPISASAMIERLNAMGVTNTRGVPVTPQDLNKQNNKLKDKGFLTKSYQDGLDHWFLTETGREAVERNMLPVRTRPRRRKVS